MFTRVFRRCPWPYLLELGASLISSIRAAKLCAQLPSFMLVEDANHQQISRSIAKKLSNPRHPASPIDLKSSWIREIPKKSLEEILEN